jgi:hypothetical protein
MVVSERVAVASGCWYCDCVSVVANFPYQPSEKSPWVWKLAYSRMGQWAFPYLPLLCCLVVSESQGYDRKRSPGKLEQTPLHCIDANP